MTLLFAVTSIESEFFVISDARTCNLDVLIEKFDWCLWIVIFSSFFFHISFAYFFSRNVDYGNGRNDYVNRVDRSINSV